MILPTKPHTPRHKGKVERGVTYVKNNGLKGHTFYSLEAQNQHLLGWEATVADTRIHGTTKRQVGKVFAEVERAALLPLPAERFPFFHEAQRIVSRDGHVEVAKAYYSVPPEYLGAPSGRGGMRDWCVSSIIDWSRSPCMRVNAGQIQHAGRALGPREDQWHRARSRLALAKAAPSAKASRSGPQRCCKRGALQEFACCKGCWR